MEDMLFKSIFKKNNEGTWDIAIDRIARAKASGRGSLIQMVRRNRQSQEPKAACTIWPLPHKGELPCHEVNSHLCPEFSIVSVLGVMSNVIYRMETY